jgi:hypothetical protein
MARSHSFVQRDGEISLGREIMDTRLGCPIDTDSKTFPVEHHRRIRHSNFIWVNRLTRGRLAEAA